MLIRIHHHYDATVPEVMRVMTDEATLRAKYADEPGGGLTSYRHRASGSGVGDAGFEIEQVRTVRFPVAPDVAKVLVPEPVIHQHERWEGPDLEGGRRATVRLDSPGLPVRAVCHVALRPVRTGGTRVETTVDLSCDVPVIGGRILDAVARAARTLIEADAAANERALAAIPGAGSTGATTEATDGGPADVTGTVLSA